VAIVLEDLQWGDATSLKLLDLALRDLRDCPLLVVGFARPEVHQLFPRLWSERAVEEIRLSPLTRTKSERFVRDLMQEAATPAGVARVLEQADGVPFYLEVIARAVAHGDEQMPEPAVALTQSRFERLEPPVRRVLRAASVFGRTFWRGGVHALVGGGPEVDDALAVLVEEKLTSTRSERRFAEEQEYEFCTELVRESAYALLTDSDRGLGHDLAAEWLEQVGEANDAEISRHQALGTRQRAALIEHHAAG
jgi:predicted ATPase